MLVHQFCSRLLSDTVGTDQVVARISPQCRIVDITRRLDTGLFLDAGLVVQGVIADTAFVVQNLHVGITNQLITVAVAGDDDNVVPRSVATTCQRCDDVVALEALHVEHRHPEGAEQLPDDSHLLPQDLGRRLALRFVFGNGDMAERGFGTVKDDHQSIGLLILQEVHEHRGETNDRIRHLTGGRCHVARKSKKCTIRKGVAVECEALHTGKPTASACRQEFVRRCPSSSCAPTWPNVE